MRRRFSQVRNARKTTILSAFERRVHNSMSAELAECLAQVHKIAWMRLRALVQPNPSGFLTCHVLDTARGCPAAGMAVTLSRRNAEVCMLPTQHARMRRHAMHGTTAMGGRAEHAGTAAHALRSGRASHACSCAFCSRGDLPCARLQHRLLSHGSLARLTRTANSCRDGAWLSVDARPPPSRHRHRAVAGRKWARS